MKKVNRGPRTQTQIQTISERASTPPAKKPVVAFAGEARKVSPKAGAYTRAMRKKEEGTAKSIPRDIDMMYNRFLLAHYGTTTLKWQQEARNSQAVRNLVKVRANLEPMQLKENTKQLEELLQTFQPKKPKKKEEAPQPGGSIGVIKAPEQVERSNVKSTEKLLDDLLDVSGQFDETLVSGFNKLASKSNKIAKELTAIEEDTNEVKEKFIKMEEEQKTTTVNVEKLNQSITSEIERTEKQKEEIDALKTQLDQFERSVAEKLGSLIKDQERLKSIPEELKEKSKEIDTKIENISNVAQKKVDDINNQVNALENKADGIEKNQNVLADQIVGQDQIIAYQQVLYDDILMLAELVQKKEDTEKVNALRVDINEQFKKLRDFKLMTVQDRVKLQKLEELVNQKVIDSGRLVQTVTGKSTAAAAAPIFKGLTEKQKLDIKIEAKADIDQVLRAREEKRTFQELAYKQRAQKALSKGKRYSDIRKQAKEWSAKTSFTTYILIVVGVLVVFGIIATVAVYSQEKAPVLLPCDENCTCECHNTPKAQVKETCHLGSKLQRGEDFGVRVKSLSTLHKL